MARGAIVGNRFAIGTGMGAVVATETTGEIIVTEIVGMDALVDLHVREDVAQVDLGDGIGGLPDERTC